MYKNTLTKFDAIFKDFIKFEHDNMGDYALLVPVSNDWDYEIPSHLLEANFMRIDIVNWSHEQTFLTDDGVHVTVAFGEDENSRFFKFDEILALMNNKGEPILTNINYKKKIELKSNEKITEPETTHTMSSIMHKEESEGIKHSMSKLSLVTPKKEVEEKPKKKKKKKKKSKDK